MKIEELYAQADRLLPVPTYYKLNYLIKQDPLNFSVPNHIRLPSGTTHKALATLAKNIYKTKQAAA